MESTKITRAYFPSHFLFFGWLLLFIGMILIKVNPWLCPLCLLVGILIVTGRQGVDFVFNERKFREFSSFIGVKSGKWEEYFEIEKIYINRTPTSQEIYTKVTTTSTIKGIEYTAYLKLVNGTKIYLKSDKNKERLISNLQDLGHKLGTVVIDNTI